MPRNCIDVIPGYAHDVFSRLCAYNGYPASIQIAFDACFGDGVGAQLPFIGVLRLSGTLDVNPANNRTFQLHCQPTGMTGSRGRVQLIHYPNGAIVQERPFWLLVLDVPAPASLYSDASDADSSLITRPPGVGQLLLRLEIPVDALYIKVWERS